jgi:anti-sigma B factor antagonist
MQTATKVVEPDVQVVEITGRFTMGAESLDVERLMDGLVARNRKRFVFDLTGVEYIDSSCLGILVNCLRKAKQNGGDMRVAASPRILGIMKVARLDVVLPSYATVADACACFREDDGIGAA